MDDSSLITGTNSSSFSKTIEQETVRRRRDEKSILRAKLVPSADLVLAAIKKEQDKIRSIEEINIEEMIIPEHFQAEIMARKKYMIYLKELYNVMSNILREPSKKVVEDE